MSARQFRLPSGPRYSRLPDNVIVDRAQSGDRQATEFLLYKYRSLVRTKTRPFFLWGGDRDDLIQVGMIGLWQSIMDYSPEQSISFSSFARICIERHVITAIKAANRRKQAFLNDAIPLDIQTDQPDADFNLADVLVSDSHSDPEEILLRRENARMTAAALRAILSPFEWSVLVNYSLGMSYREIAQRLGCNTKSVDNALGRVKRKISGTAAHLCAQTPSFAT